MKTVLIKEDCKYAQSKPSLPILEFIKGEKYPLDDYLADSIIANGHGNEPTVKPETKENIKPEMEDKVNPETKEKPRKIKAHSAKGNK